MDKPDNIDGAGPAEASLTDLIDGLERASFRRALEARDAHLAGVFSSAADPDSDCRVSVMRGRRNPPVA